MVNINEIYKFVGHVDFESENVCFDDTTSSDKRKYFQFPSETMPTTLFKAFDPGNIPRSFHTQN